MTTGHITDISPIQDDFICDGFPRGIKAVELTIRITYDQFRELNPNPRRPTTITQEGEQ